MGTAQFASNDVLKLFARKKVLTKTELLQSCGCSAMTAWRILSKQGYLTSYNHNARYYTLVRIPQFDPHGLWDYRGIRFSRWGTLPRTVLALVEHSPAGMTAQELEALLHVPNVKPTLTKLASEGRLERAKIGDAFSYFARDRGRHQQQLEQRRAALPLGRPGRPLPDPPQIIALLVEMIQRPRSAHRQWARRLARQGISLEPAAIQAVMDHYGLSVKKGLLSS
jgi:hypothetical protein